MRDGRPQTYEYIQTKNYDDDAVGYSEFVCMVQDRGLAQERPLVTDSC